MHTFMGPFSECCTKLRVWPCRRSAQAFRKCWSDCFKQWIINGLYRICRNGLDTWSCHHRAYGVWLTSILSLLSCSFCFVLFVVSLCSSFPSFLSPHPPQMSRSCRRFCHHYCCGLMLSKCNWSLKKVGEDLLMQFKSWKNWRSNLSAFRVRWCIAVR